MRKQSVLGTALVALLVALPLVSFGLTADQPVLAWIGMAALLLGGLLPPVAHYMFKEKDKGT